MRIRYSTFRPALKAVSSPAVTVALLLIMAILVVYGTVHQVRHSLYEAQQHVFDAWIILAAGFVPFPGVKLACTLLFVNLLAAVGVRMRWVWRNSGLFLVHAGIIALVAGAGIGYAVRQEASVTLAEGEMVPAGRVVAAETPARTREIRIPLSLQLNGFVVKRGSVTNAIVDFESHVHVKDDAMERDAVISMNRPLRYRDYTFYQSSYTTEGGRNFSTLAVVRNPVRIVPYFASIMIASGLIIHFLFMVIVSTRKKHGS
jgi:cytochrome c biogenesis protein ResB